MAKIIACTQIDKRPVYINLDNVLFIGERQDGRTDFKFVSDVSLSVKETLDEVLSAIAYHGHIIEASRKQR